MLKIKDNTSKQDFSVQNTGFWDNELIKSILSEMKSIRNGVIYVNDITVKEIREKIKGNNSIFKIVTSIFSRKG